MVLKNRADKFAFATDILFKIKSAGVVYEANFQMRSEQQSSAFPCVQWSLTAVTILPKARYLTVLWRSQIYIVGFIIDESKIYTPTIIALGL